MDPLIKSQLLYQLSYAPFRNVFSNLGYERILLSHCLVINERCPRKLGAVPFGPEEIAEWG